MTITNKILALSDECGDLPLIFEAKLAPVLKSVSPVNMGLPALGLMAGGRGKTLAEEIKADRDGERERITDIVDFVAAHYPEAIFPDDSKSPDAIAAKGARLACKLIREKITAENV